MSISPPADRSRGFTLIEIVVVTAIAAILAALAYPAYTSYLARARRADARAVLLEAAQFLERHYAARGAYDSAALPQRLQTAPAGGAGRVNYALTLDATEIAYTLTAVLSAEQVDDCGSLVLTNTGARSRTGTALSDEACWR